MNPGRYSLKEPVEIGGPLWISEKSYHLEEFNSVEIAASFNIYQNKHNKYGFKLYAIIDEFATPIFQKKKICNLDVVYDNKFNRSCNSWNGEVNC